MTFTPSVRGGKTRLTHRAVALGASLLLIVSLAACSSSSEGSATAEKKTRTSAPTDSADTDTDAEEPSSSDDEEVPLPGDKLEKLTAPEDDPADGPADKTKDDPAPAADGLTASVEDPVEVVSFGDTYKWENGIEASFSAIEEYTPGKYASIGDWPELIRFTITLTNNSGEAFDPSGASIVALSQEIASSRAYDSEAGLSSAPSTSILDGRSVTWDVGFGVMDSKDLTIEFSPSYDHEVVLFVVDGAGAQVPEAGPGDKADGNQATFGQYVSWQNGVSVAVSEPTEFTPGEYVEVVEGATYVMFTIRVTNDGAGAYNSGWMSVSAQSGSSEADSVFDSENGVSSTSPYVVLKQGGSAIEFPLAFAVEDPADIVLQVRPNYGDDEAYFTS